MHELDILAAIEDVTKANFKDILVWDQNSKDLIGKYFYIQYYNRNLGVFMGYSPNKDRSYCMTLLFIHPSLYTEANNIEIKRLFHGLMIRANMRLRDNPYKIIHGRAPGLVRNIIANELSFNDIKRFFHESVLIIRNSKPLYKE